MGVFSSSRMAAVMDAVPSPFASVTPLLEVIVTSESAITSPDRAIRAVREVSAGSSTS